jgi:hypothetical protein
MDDRELKHILVSDKAPPVRVGLIERIVAMIAPVGLSSAVISNANGFLIKRSGWRYQWATLSLLVIMLVALAQPLWLKHLSHSEDELNSIDTLSLSSLMTL